MAATRKKLKREYGPDGQVVSKECRRCNSMKSIDEFYTTTHKGRSPLDGHTHICKQCSKKHWKQLGEDSDNRCRWLLQRIKTKCKKLNIPFDITLDDLVIPDVCPVLGIPLKFGVKTANKFRERRGVQTPDDSPSVDRIFPELGYIKGNIVIVSYRANNIKTNATPEELQQVALFYAKYCKKASEKK